MSVHKRKMQNLESERSNPAATDEKPGAFGRDDSAYGSTNGGGTWPTATLPPASEKLIVNWEELPHWMQDNIFIHTGYRPENFSYVKCLKSLFYLHNEWVNIWSHLLGAIGFIILLFVTYYVVFQPLSETLRWTDIAVFYAFLAGAITCLGLSASFHTYMCHSEGASAMWNRCDYVGIRLVLPCRLLQLLLLRHPPNSVPNGHLHHWRRDGMRRIRAIHDATSSVQFRPDPSPFLTSSGHRHDPQALPHPGFPVDAHAPVPVHGPVRRHPFRARRFIVRGMWIGEGTVDSG
ncbi:hypothetical protein BC938DRAFT_472082 [Jimgerdemannia flammicorona]|uniref:Hemolysin-III related-domain-containing protein n=1 Tax=Jimgerdemannia flammicorona TaxID=994334 RepID=A0A433Q6T1_9FUNG|nr:hypothetical protein BC938DRAFT_472082 [Jimgerdemannia flammicorona]